MYNSQSNVQVIVVTFCSPVKPVNELIVMEMHRVPQTHMDCEWEQYYRVSDLPGISQLHTQRVWTHTTCLNTHDQIKIVEWNYLW